MSWPLTPIEEDIERGVAYMMNMLIVELSTRAFGSQEDIVAWAEAFEKKNKVMTKFLHFIEFTQYTTTTEMIPSADNLGVTIIIKFLDRDKNVQSIKKKP